METESHFKKQPDTADGRADGHHIKNCGDNIAVVQIIHHPHELGADQNQLEMDRIFHIQEPGEHNGSQDRQQLNPGKAAKGKGQCCLQRNETKFQPEAGFSRPEHQVSDNADNTADKTGHRAQHQMSRALEYKLNALDKQNPVLISDQTDGDHDAAADQRQ